MDTVSAPGRRFSLGIIGGRRSGAVIEQPPPQPMKEQQSPNIIRTPSFAETETSTTKSTTGKPKMAHLQTLEAKVRKMKR